jgi:hypothetical protein
MVHSLKKIRSLTKALRGDKTEYARLMKESPEYAAMGAALVGNTAATHWLLAQDNKTFAVFVDAVIGNKTALQLLMKEKQYELAAVSNMLNEDEEALKWLEKHKLKDYFDFAMAIQYAMDKEVENDLSGYFTLYG